MLMQPAGTSSPARPTKAYRATTTRLAHRAGVVSMTSNERREVIGFLARRDSTRSIGHCAGTSANIWAFLSVADRWH